MTRIGKSLFNQRDIFQLKPSLVQLPYQKVDQKDYQPAIAVTSQHGYTSIEAVSDVYMTKEDAQKYADEHLATYEKERQKII